MFTVVVKVGTSGERWSKVKGEGDGHVTCLEMCRAEVTCFIISCNIMQRLTL